ncbi:MAG TPA: acyl-CoA dehydrogenase N-terminal domain-containing protein [Spongiibacteraceae bacterium]|jgi:butyryl-CoA dehydrogenase
MSSTILARRDLEFLLCEWLDVEALTARQKTAVAEHEAPEGGSLFQDKKVILSKLRCYSPSEKLSSAARPTTPKRLECSPRKS